MTFIQICDGCGKGRVPPLCEHDDDTWYTFKKNNPEEVFVAGALKGRPFDLDFCSDECAVTGLKKLYSRDLDLVEFMKKHDIELVS